MSEFDAPSGWRDRRVARKEVQCILRDGFARAATADEQLVGWAGALPEYHGHVWELHPVVVHRDHRQRGIGRALVEAIEHEIQRRGARTLTLGTDDDAVMTSVGGVELYPDVVGHLRELRDLDRRHPFLFYQRLGFVVTGIMPDANGPGRPDIYMSKRVAGASIGHVDDR
ncbi:MAG TPA: GNAT family N-acetyltransferase [Gemmatimonadaceae bacterium]